MAKLSRTSAENENKLSKRKIYDSKDLKSSKILVQMAITCCFDLNIMEETLAFRNFIETSVYHWLRSLFLNYKGDRQEPTPFLYVSLKFERWIFLNDCIKLKSISVKLTDPTLAPLKTVSLFLTSFQN